MGRRWLPKKVAELDGIRVVRVACGWRHSVVVDDIGHIYTFGWSKYGQLGHGDLACAPLTPCKCRCRASLYDDHVLEPILVHSARTMLE